MVPRTEMVWIERNKSLRQAMALASRSGMSRIPVIGEDVDDVVGVVYLKDLVANAMTLDPADRGPVLTEIIREPVFVPESKNVDDLLREMQRDRSHFAVVVDEYGGTAGIVTIEDILEEIVGEITDEYDADTPAPVEPLEDGSFRVSARLPVEDLGELFDVELDDDEVDTVGGLLAQQLGRVPLPGSRASVAGLVLLGEPGVDRRGRPRVQTLLVRRLTRKELAAAEADRERQAREREERRLARENRQREPDEPAAPDGAAEPADRDGEAEPGKARKKKKKAKQSAAPPDPEPAPADGSRNGSAHAAGTGSQIERAERNRAG
jgi:Mg2+/Co2+ transporter CorC